MHVVYMCEYREEFFFQKLAYKKYMYVKKSFKKFLLKFIVYGSP